MTPGARRPRAGSDLGGDRIEGRRAVLEAVVAGRRRIREVAVAATGTDGELVDRIRSEADARGIPVNVVDSETFGHKARTEAPQGVMAFGEPIPSADVDALLDAPDAFLVALDGVTDPGNVGAVLRSAAAAGATGAILPRRRSAHLSPAAMKAAAGSAEHLPIAVVAGIPAALERAARAGVWAVGLDASGDSDVFDLALADQRLCLVLGSEGRGLARLVRERCDLVASIPMAGPVESLNVGAAAAVACAVVARLRREASASR